jgi:hypothetical protein
MGLRVGGKCETTAGPGRVVAIEDATRWKPASVIVELASGDRRFFRPLEVKPTREGT